MPAPDHQMDRRIDAGALRFAVVGKNRSALYAANWLAKLGASLVGARVLEEARALEPRPLAILIAGDSVGRDEPAEGSDGPTEIRLWDYEVGVAGIGAFASAVSGVSTVIGAADGPPGLMPAHIPEKWAGMYGASLALSLQLATEIGRSPLPRTIDVSAADVLRAFAEQNSGNHAGVPYGWRRNGRAAVEHGGVFPQGFFACGDGHVAVQARSRQDWQGIIAALGHPAWSQQKEFQNPFKLSEDDSRIAPLLESELKKHGRLELLQRALESGAPMAPVLTLEEARGADVFRAGFLESSGALAAPFVVKRTAHQEKVQ
jgi:crotonobetainyl-CoA:carnitine CoA-transferase CaiB-like acyl-CoA transferase